MNEPNVLVGQSAACLDKHLETHRTNYSEDDDDDDDSLGCALNDYNAVFYGTF